MQQVSWRLKELRLFPGGTVAYQREAKETQLGIVATLLDQYGMVSAECAKAMAEQARLHYQSDLGISLQESLDQVKWKEKKSERFSSH